MPTALALETLHDTYGEGYSRTCPRCRKLWSTGRNAIECWYQDDPEGISSLSIPKIAHIMGVSQDTVRSTWRTLIERYGAKERQTREHREGGDAYHKVVHFLRRQKQKKHGLPRGWTERLADECEVTRQRISQLARKARARGEV